jgi:glycosyltransferase involved in cell wall biosynthesis
MAKQSILIIRNAYRWQDGGAEKFATNLAGALKQHGYEPILVSNVPELKARAKAAGLKYYPNLWLHNRGSQRWRPVYRLLRGRLINQYLRLIKRHRVRLVIAMSQDDQLYAGHAAASAGVPVIWIDHADLKHTLSNHNLIKPYTSALKSVQKVVAVSRAEKAAILERAGELRGQLASKLIVIPNGIEIGSATSPMPHPSGKKVITYIGRLEKDKGVYEILAAARQLAKTHPDIVFWLIGKGPAEKQLKANASKWQINNLDFFGYQTNIFNYLISSDLFIYPTHHDAAPLAPLEALATGVPVVASRVGGLPEIIDDHCGRLIPPGNPTALARAIAEAVGSPQIQASLSRGAKSQGKKYLFANIVKTHYLPLIKEVIHS